ncbi:MAG: hypothetical protein IT530_04085 [Burkholderiales bacterium]|nr:hypothetical protein [Burkholderiales bacterium]
MSHELRLYKDEIAPQAAVALALSPVRAIYVVSGGLRVHSPALAGALGANSAVFPAAGTRFVGGHLATVVLRWELVAAAAPEATLAGDGVTSTRLLAAPMALDKGREWLLRGDRVDFPPDGEALTHTHRGGGIRCLLTGTIRIDTQGASHSYGPLGAWFEAGPDPVYAKVSVTQDSGFARVMILPRDLLGKSSISYVNPADLAKPKNQRYQVFIDVPIELP